MTCESYLAFQDYRKALIDSRKETREYQSYRRGIQDRVNKAYQKMAKCQRYRNRMN